MIGRTFLLAGLVLGSAGCAEAPRCGDLSITAGSRHECRMPGWVDRAYDLYAPAAHDGTTPLPLVLVFHGGGGNKTNARSMTCPEGGDTSSCMQGVGNREGFYVVYPNGTGKPVRNSRTWNAGGGRDGWACMAGAACKGNVDDTRYVLELLDEVGRAVPVDPARIYATGLSNGSAISHRLGCELSDRFAAIAGVGGGNNHAMVSPCTTPVPVMQIHGTEDRCIPFSDPETPFCSDLVSPGRHATAIETVDFWRGTNGCAEPATETALPNLDPADGTTTTRVEWPGCTERVVLLRVDGGGHTWPGGHINLSTEIVGRTSRDFSASEEIWSFFEGESL